jgi:hypothetical protein
MLVVGFVVVVVVVVAVDKVPRKHEHTLLILAEFRSHWLMMAEVGSDSARF